MSSDDDKLEREVYYPDVANILGSKNETQTSFEYLVNNTQEFFRNYPDIFDSDLREFFKDIASKEKEKIDYNLLSKKNFMSP